MLRHIAYMVGGWSPYSPCKVSWVVLCSRVGGVVGLSGSSGLGTLEVFGWATQSRACAESIAGGGKHLGICMTVT